MILKTSSSTFLDRSPENRNLFEYFRVSFFVISNSSMPSWISSVVVGNDWFWEVVFTESDKFVNFLDFEKYTKYPIVYSSKPELR